MIKRQRNYEKICSVILYLLPALFLAACYFLMTVTGEDLLQGAGLKGQYLYRAKNAFEYNARLSDMYAWGIIGAFDYIYSFGLDTVFRALDVLMGIGIVYIISYIGIGRRLKLCIGDALVFNTVFCAVFLDKNCESLYIAFSHIHNYLIIGIFTMIFYIPFARKAQGVVLPDGLCFKLGIMLLGFLFGFSSNITPIVFLISFFICMLIWLINVICNKTKINFKKIITSWETFAVLGVVFACILMYGIGKGFSTYINEGYINATDYISFNNIFSAPKYYIPKVLNHIYENFYEMFPCIALLLIALIVEAALYGKNKQNDRSRAGIIFVSCSMLFVVLHILAMSQIRIVLIARLAMPAYFVALSAICFSVIDLIKQVDLNKACICLYSIALIILSGTMVFDVAGHRYEYNRRIGEVVEAISKTENDFYYIPYTKNHIEKSEIFGFNQYGFVQDWVVGQVQVCGKTAYIDYDN